MAFIKITQPWYEVLLMVLTGVIVTTYIYVYISAKREYGDKYLPLIITGRTLILASFLIFFYNPLRSEFQYGRSLPFLAFTAGMTLISFLDKYQVLSLVHFVLYGDILPIHPKKVCRLVNDDDDENVVSFPIPGNQETLPVITKKPPTE